MPGFKINDAEWDALYDQPPELFKVYCAIRRYMNFDNCRAGDIRRLSEQYFREQLSYSAAPGRAKSAPISRKKVRHQLEYLEKLGVIKRVGPLVFECILADEEKSVQKIRGRFGANSGANGGANKNNYKHMIIKENEKEDGPEVGTSDPSRWGRPPVSGIINNINIINNNNNAHLDQKIIKIKPDWMAEAFEQFWSHYPRKVGKKKASEVFTKTVKGGGIELAKKILTALSAQIPVITKNETRYQPHPATWLNQGRWDDEVVRLETIEDLAEKYFGGVN